MNWCFIVAAALAFVPVTAVCAAIEVSDYGAKCDGSADDSAAIQKALDAAAKSGGGVVELGAGKFRMDNPVTVPEGVTLAGVWQAPHHAQLQKGTVIEVYAGKGEEDGTPLINLSPSSAVKGVTFFYPEQRIPGTQAYPWTIQGRGMHCSVMDCTFVNSYKAVDFGTHHNELHYIRNCFGCPLKVGVHIDQCTDIGRIENVHFNPHYWARADVAGIPQWQDELAYLQKNLVAFEFGRTDWEYVHNTFVFGAKTGYRFYKSENGTVNGNFLGIGADMCGRAMLVEECQQPGLLITNGEFVGGKEAGWMIEVSKKNTGVVQMNNCSFWGPSEGVALVDGNGTVSLSQCNFLNWQPERTGAYTIDVRGGDITVDGCRFAVDAPDIRLGKDVKSGIIMGNRFKGNTEVENLSEGDVQEGLNVVTR